MSCPANPSECFYCVLLMHEQICAFLSLECILLWQKGIVFLRTRSQYMAVKKWWGSLPHLGLCAMIWPKVRSCIANGLQSQGGAAEVVNSWCPSAFPVFSQCVIWPSAHFSLWAPVWITLQSLCCHKLTLRSSCSNYPFYSIVGIATKLGYCCFLSPTDLWISD